MKRIVLVIAFCLLLLSQLNAIHPVVSIYSWCELDPFIYEQGMDYPLSKEEAARRLLEEARQVFSGMIYGYSFTYTPSDKARQVSEEFDLLPHSEILWGDTSLSIEKSKIIENRLVAKANYVLNAAQINWLSAWQSADIEVSEARGESDLFKGSKNKIKALENAIKEAIRYWARNRYFNKPKQIKGRLIIEEEPVFTVNAGKYIAHTRIRLIIDHFLHYKIY
ncbi:MAG: hypothetical protein JXR70_05705 [Spirochaetales bacterium]|nr:hypothetical protein [Spirochaetales bacterium]